MTAPQVAAMLLMPESTIQDYARRGLLPSIKIGRHRRFKRDEVLEALDACHEAGGSLKGGHPG